MNIDQKEVLRYMGWRRGTPDKEIFELIERISAEFLKSVKPKCSSKTVPITVFENKVLAENILFESEKLAKHLKGASSAVILSATLGVEADIIIKRNMVSGTLNASAAQAVGAAMIESYLDEIEKKLEAEGLTLLPRFSPGFCDWKLSDGKKLLDITDGVKRCGITFSSSFMMLPTKSVTAIIGILDTHKKDCEE